MEQESWSIQACNPIDWILLAQVCILANLNPTRELEDYKWKSDN
jgi:hypothetical protein